MKTLTIIRAGYSKDSTPKEDREYRMLSGGPVGTIKDWMEFAKENGYTDIAVLDKDGKQEAALTVHK